jgi:LPS O-antigen subunit length determinant protein (WzzB/FepE family)
LIALIGFITVVFKIVIILVFVALILGVGFVLLRAWNESRRKHE